jgi:hypothetical protein
MLDALFGKSASNKQQVDELQALVNQAKEERAALSAMLTQWRAARRLADRTAEQSAKGRRDEGD